MYKYMPPTKVSWKAAWSGGAVGGLLFIIGRYIIGLYITFNVISSVYGVAAAVVIILVWFYYLAQIFFFGTAISYAVDQNAKLSQTSL